jgi:hypothetical protein
MNRAIRYLGECREAFAWWQRFLARTSALHGHAQISGATINDVSIKYRACVNAFFVKRSAILRFETNGKLK